MSNFIKEEAKSVAETIVVNRGYWGYQEMTEAETKKTTGAGCGGCGGCGGCSGCGGDASGESGDISSIVSDAEDIVNAVDIAFTDPVMAIIGFGIAVGDAVNQGIMGPANPENTNAMGDSY